MYLLHSISVLRDLMDVLAGLAHLRIGVLLSTPLVFIARLKIKYLIAYIRRTICYAVFRYDPDWLPDTYGLSK